MSKSWRGWRGIAGVVVCVVLALLARSSAALAELALPLTARSSIIFVIAGGWHTELALPTASIVAPLNALVARFPGARYLVFGWGARGYYMARHPGFADLLRAATPGPAVMLVIPLTVSPAAFAGPGNACALLLSVSGAGRLSRFLWDDLAAEPESAPRALGPGPVPGSVFYAAAGTYDLSHTCNTWTAEALHTAGLPVTGTGVVFAGQLLDQLKACR